MASEPSSRAAITRRALLIGGGSVVVLGAAGVAGVETNILPGRSTLHRVLGLDGTPGTVPKNTPGQLVSGSFISKARLGKSVGWTVSYPPGSKPGDALPVLLILHGFGSSHSAAFGATRHGLDHFLAQAVSAGSAPMALASIDGGNSYWHTRASGEDAAAMVVDEYLPLLKSQGLDTSRLGFLGWSMGGYGSLHIGAMLGPERVRVIVAESPALWARADQSAAGAFDGAADFAANTVVGRQHQLDGIPVRIDCGTGDGFYPEAERYAAGFTTRPSGGFQPGGHNNAYWRRVAPAELVFAAKYLSA